MLKRFLAARRPRTSSDWAAPGVFALAGLLIFPSVAAEADVTGLVSAPAGAAAWRSYMTPIGAGSIQNAEIVFKESGAKGYDPANRGLVLAGGQKVALSADKREQPETPDEARVTRSLKKGRVLASERVRPPQGFSAGSILDRQAHLLAPELTEERVTMFQKPALKGKEIEIALAFHAVRPRLHDDAASSMLASLITNEKGDSLASAYANPEPDYAEQSPFDSILVKPNADRFVPDVGKEAHGWAANVLPASVFSEKEQKCLAEAIYFEAITEPLKGQAAVAQVVLNRVRNPSFPNTICGVVYQNEDWRNRCQFSFACDRIPDVIWSRARFDAAKQVALAVTAGKIYLKSVGDSTHYHAVYVRPNWARTMKRVSRIGLHIFYRTYGGGWV
ncbi:spore germination cell wall hydrolase CwlJ-like protein [Rhizobium sp. SG_E_25_P2]|nr:spore germination cell wall hydrolase CwlJ-like protein [Rhizobium sp. SG_E_25_P2]